MLKNKIVEFLNDNLCEYFNDNQVLDTYSIDSFQFIQIIVEMENELNIEVSESLLLISELEDFESFADKIVSFIE